MTGSKHLSIVAAAVVAGLAFRAAPVAAAELVVVERAASDTVTDTGAKGDSVGDILTFSNEIYDRQQDTDRP